MIRTLHLAFLATLAALALAACGDDADGPAPGDDPGDAGASFPVTVEAANGPVTVEAPPGRIVSLSPTATEMLFAIGAGEQVVAVDEFSYYPPEAPVTDLSGFTPNLEAIAELDPDLVVVSFDAGDVVAGLGRIGVPVALLPGAADLDDVYRQIEQLGALTGNVGGAAEVVATMQADIEAAVAGLPERDEPLTYYHEVDDTHYSVTSDSFIGQVYGLAGLRSIADAADDGSGFPQLSAEFILEADPDLIFVPTLGDADPAGEIAARPGWDTLRAVQQDRVVAIDGDIASRWGPRLVQLLEAVVGAVADVGEPVAG